MSIAHVKLRSVANYITRLENVLREVTSALESEVNAMDAPENLMYRHRARLVDRARNVLREGVAK